MQLSCFFQLKLLIIFYGRSDTKIRESIHSTLVCCHFKSPWLRMGWDIDGTPTCACIVDDSLWEEKQRSESRAYDSSFALSLFKSWVTYMNRWTQSYETFNIQGDIHYFVILCFKFCFGWILHKLLVEKHSKLYVSDENTMSTAWYEYFMVTM